MEGTVFARVCEDNGDSDVLRWRVGRAEEGNVNFVFFEDSIGICMLSKAKPNNL